MRLLGPGCPPGLSYSGFWRKEGFVIKTCTGVLFITEKTGNNPIAPARDWPGRYTEEGTEMPACDAGNVTGGRAAWRQEPRVWGSQTQCSVHTARNYGTQQPALPSCTRYGVTSRPAKGDVGLHGWLGGQLCAWPPNSRQASQWVVQDTCTGVHPRETEHQGHEPLPRLTCWQRALPRLPLSSPTGNGGGGFQEMGPDPSDSPGNAMHPSCLPQPLGLL